MRSVGVDFGTTNSALAVVDGDGAPELARFPTANGDRTTFRSILYFERGPDGRATSAAGPHAIARYLAPEDEGRLIQSLKTFLASRLFSQTSVLGVAYRLEALVALILRDLRLAAEEQFGELGTRLVVGRPVRFANAESREDEELALRRLRAAFTNAGFPDVVFEYEPVAAAYTYEARLEQDELIVIADFGGGTSDFSLLRVGPGVCKAGRRAEALLGTAGVPVAGDSFDARFVHAVVAPELGMGGVYRSVFNRTLRVPDWIYSHLQRWNHLSFLKTPKTLQILHDLAREATEPERFRALLHLVREDRGFELYQSVQDTKEGLSAGELAPFAFMTGPVEIARELAREDFEDWIEGDLVALETCLDGLFTDAGVDADDVDRVFLTGGSSFVPAVRTLFASRFGIDKIRSGGELTSVATGLALRARELPPD